MALKVRDSSRHVFDINSASRWKDRQLFIPICFLLALANVESAESAKSNSIVPTVSILLSENIVPIGTCAVPLDIKINDFPLNGSTAHSIHTTTWSGQCAENYNRETGAGFLDTLGGESFYRFEVTSPQYVNISVEPSPSSPSYLAYYLRSSCDDASTEVWSACKGNATPSAPASEVELLGAGTYDIIVDGLGTVDNAGEFTVQLQSAVIPVCGGGITQLPMVIDPSANTVMVSDSTAAGAAETVISSNPAYCSVEPISSGRTFGNERIFAFALAKRDTVRIDLQLTSALGDYPTGLYLRSDNCGERDIRDVVLREMENVCAATNDSGLATIERELPAGTYYIFVDESRAGVTHTFDLSVTQNP